MKPLQCLLFFLLFLPLFSLAQAPQGINYQAIARYQGVVIANQTIDLRITIYDGPGATNVVYVETHQVLTTQYGLFNIEIGNGVPTIGLFSDVDWSTGDEYMEVEIDANSSGFVSLGSKAFWSVPYSLHAETAGKAVDMSADDLNDVDTTGLNSGDYLQWNGTDWVPAGGTNLSYTGGNGISITGNIISNTGDNDPSDDITIATPASGDLTGFYPSPTVARIRNVPVLNTAPSANQVLKFNNGAWAPSFDNVNDPDSDPNNEIQTLSIAGSILSLSAGGGSVNLPFTSYVAGVGINITGNVITNTGDTDPNDDITVGSTAGGDLSGTYPNPTVSSIQGFNVSTAMPATGETLKWDGNQWTPANDNVNDPDSDPFNELQTLSINGNQLTLSGGGGSVSLPTYIGGLGINVVGSVISNTGDVNPNDDVTIGSTAGGDLGGTYPNPSVTRIHGRVIANTAPNSNYVYKWDQANGQWVPMPDDDTDADADPLNEIQTLSVSGNVLSLSGGNSVNLPTSSYTGGTGIAISGSTIINIGDADASDDITNTTTAGGDLNGTYPSPTVDGLQGNPVSSSSPTAVGQALLWDGFQWAPGSVGNTPWTTSGSNISYSTGNVGINTSSPTSELEVNGTSTVVDASGNLRVETGSDANGGFVNVYNSSNLLKVGLRIDGSGQGEVFGDVKNFRIDHPTNPDHEIWYASLEGPEAAAYVRGTATLVDGKVEIEFDDHFQLVSNPETMTVILTPLSADSKGLAVIEKTEEGFSVKELFNGQGNYSFDWEVKCVRRGHEDFRVIRKKK